MNGPRGIQGTGSDLGKGTSTITRQQFRRTGRKAIERGLAAKYPGMSRCQRKATSSLASRRAWKKSRKDSKNVIAEMVAKQKETQAIAEVVLEAFR